jgi:small GTP-binding protein
MVAQLADSTTVYHIGTPTLFPSSANPSITLSTSSDPPEKLNPVILSPLLDESNALGRMVSVKPVQGQKTSSSHVLKLIVLGDASVGKTALIQRFVNGFFQPLPYKPTVGADFYSQKLEYTLPASGETITLTLQIWDTAGQERYKSLASSFYRGADICVIVEDCTKPDHLKSVAQWHEDFLRHAAPFEPESFPFMFLLNKSDLLGDAEAVALEKNWRKQVSDRFGVPKSRAGTVSAKSGENVEDSLFLATKIGAQRTLKSYNQIRAQPTGGVINLNNRPGEEDSFFNNCLC